MPRKNHNKPLNLFFLGLKLMLLGASPSYAQIDKFCPRVYALMPETLTQWTQFRPNAVAQELGVKYSIGAGELSPALVRLRQILTTPHSPESSDPIAGKDLKARLEDWRTEFEIPFEFIFPEDFERLRKDPAVTGIPGHSRPYVHSDNGFMDITTYKAAVASGRWPLFDPHDVINHLPDIVDKGWRARLVRHAKVVLRARELRPQSNQKPSGVGLEGYLSSTVRNSTYETHLYLEPGVKPPRLVLRGAQGLNLLESLTKGQNGEAIAATYAWSPVAGDKPEDWPNFKEYLAARGGELYRRQQAAMTKIGAGENGKSFQEKYEKALAKAMYWHPKKQGRSDAAEAKRVEQILTNLANNINKDSFLKEAFNEENKAAALDLSLDLAEDFLNWSAP